MTLRSLFLSCLTMLLAACAGKSLNIESTVDPQYINPLQRVLIVANAELFPPSSKQVLFMPTLTRIQRILDRHGVSWAMVEPLPGDMNPGQAVAVAARKTGATHVLYFSVTRTASFGPKVPENDPRSQHRLMTDYTYGMLVSDLRAGRNVWKAEVQSGSGTSSDEDLRQFEEKLTEHLYRGRLLALR